MARFRRNFLRRLFERPHIVVRAAEYVSEQPERLGKDSNVISAMRARSDARAHAGS